MDFMAEILIVTLYRP